MENITREEFKKKFTWWLTFGECLKIFLICEPNVEYRNWHIRLNFWNPATWLYLFILFITLIIYHVSSDIMELIKDTIELIKINFKEIATLIKNKGIII